MTGGGVYGLVIGGGGGVELFVAVGVALLDGDAELEAEDDPEAELLLGEAEGLLLGVPLSEGQGDGEPGSVGVALADAVGVPALAPPEGSTDEELDAAADAEADADCEGDAQLLGAPVDAVASATPAFAGITSRAPIATVPVATAPATDTADRLPLRACPRTCLGTFQPPAFAACRAFGSCARAGAHRPTVTNLVASGHPRSN
jgi:hypothetical protein